MIIYKLIPKILCEIAFKQSLPYGIYDITYQINAPNWIITHNIVNNLLLNKYIEIMVKNIEKIKIIEDPFLIGSNINFNCLCGPTKKMSQKLQLYFQQYIKKQIFLFDLTIIQLMNLMP